MDFIALFEVVQAQEQQKYTRLLYRHIRDTENPFDVSELCFIKTYRIPKYLTIEMIEELTPLLYEGRYKNSIPIHLKFLSALSFYASGAYQRCVGNETFISLSQTCISNNILEVSVALNKLMSKYIQFPRTEEDCLKIKQEFYDYSDFPGVIGAIDGTHVALLRPSKDEHIYYNRKHYHSLNVLLACDLSLNILYINARFGGSTHDSFIWRTSKIKQHMEIIYGQGDRSSWLLGDSGFPIQPWLMTPLQNPTTDQERKYNKAHIRCRNPIERLNGVLKTRFRCLLKERVLRYSPKRVGLITNACAVLHNFLNSKGIPIDDRIEVIDDQVEPDPLHTNDYNENHQLRDGLRIRQNLINNSFS